MTSSMKDADFYGTKFSLKYRAKDSFQTNFGGFLSIVTYLLVLYYSAIQVKQLVLKQNPYILEEIQFREESLATNFTAEEIRFGFALSFTSPSKGGPGPNLKLEDIEDIIKFEAF